MAQVRLMNGRFGPRKVEPVKPKRLPNGRFMRKAPLLPGEDGFDALPPLRVNDAMVAEAQADEPLDDWFREADDYVDQPDEPMPEQGVPGCNCDICRIARGEIDDPYNLPYNGQALAVNMAVQAAPIPEAPKGKPLKNLPKKKQPKPTEFDMKMSDIPLLDPAKATLDKAIALMIEYRDKARESTKVSQFILVGPQKIKKRLNEICHACLSSDLPGNEDTTEKKCQSKFDYIKGQEVWWNFEHECWQDEYVERGKGRYGPSLPVKYKKAHYPYRYMVGFSNRQQKAQYHSGDEKPFKGKRLKACMAYWDWLRNKSHWSRFFVGPSDKKFIADYGFILDLSAPSFIVHMAAVAWRMPGEYIELVESWHAMVKRGIDPHVAFACAQNYTGFDNPDGVIDNMMSSGHYLLGRVSFETMARLVTGTVHVFNAGTDLQQARQFYTSSSNRHYCGANEYSSQSWHSDPSLLQDKARVASIMRPGYFGQPEHEAKCVSSRAFQRMFDPGWAWLFGKLSDMIVKKGWY